MDNFLKSINQTKYKDIQELLNKKIRIKPTKEALFAFFAYFIFGFNWILWSDTILSFLVKDVETYKKIQIFKGWLYVFLSSLLIYFIVYSRTKVLNKALQVVEDNQLKLKETLENLFESEEKLKNMIYFDPLTKLPSRLGLELYVESLINENKKFALLHINFDNFNHINETLGHSIGDEFLIEMSKKIKSITQKSMIGRFGSDEFGIVVDNFEKPDDIKDLITESLKNIDKRWIKNNYEYFVSFCVGISLFPEDGLNKTLIFRNADLALKKAKNEGKSKFVFYSGEIFKYNLEKVKIKNQLDYAIEKRELHLYYQPQYFINSNKIKGMEVLLRWKGPQGFIPPDVFIPIAEESGQIFEIEKWVFKNSLDQKLEFENRGLGYLSLSINLSSKTLMSHDNFQDLINLLKSYDIDFTHITFEITETDVIFDLNLAITQLSVLKELGVKIALDDFGTGYSSLNHLKKLPIDIIKLDKSFVSSIERNKSDTSIIKSLLLLAIDLGYDVVAEGVETENQLDFLKKFNCKFAQGYLMSKPVPINELYKIIS